MIKAKLLVLLALFWFLLFGFGLRKLTSTYSKKVSGISFTAVYAEEDDDEDEDEEEEEDEDYEDSDDETPQESYETVVQLAPQPIVKNVTVIDPEFTTDTDGDKLVDAIDPNPTIPQWKFFTDTDNDGVAEAFDLHPNENDFLYITLEDSNNNGIVDTFEALHK